MEKFFKWFTPVFLIIHGSSFIGVGILILRLEDVSSSPDNSYNALILFPLIGLITLLIGAVILIMNIMKNIKVKRLKADGIEIIAEITGFRKTLYRINRIPLYRITAEDRNGNVYYSDAMLMKKIERKYKAGDKITVLVSKKNDKDYTMPLD